MAKIDDHALIGNKRTAALVTRSGTVDWLCPKRFDAPSAFAALLDPERGGAFTLAPADDDFSSEQRYVPDTNVIQTTFTTAGGVVRVTDAMVLSRVRALDYNQLVRRIDGISGEVALRWRVAPRFGYGTTPGVVTRRADAVTIEGGGDLLSVQAYDAGDFVLEDHAVGGAFTCAAGDRALIALSSFDTGPIALCGPPELEARLEATLDHWRTWAGQIPDVGRWSEACRRSLLALDLMVDARSGGIVAAPTLGLPERPGGDRNYDYRYVWLRDANLTLEAMLRLGMIDQVHASLRWTFAATERSHPRLRPVFTIDGDSVPAPHDLPLDGYDGGTPVRAGNRAGGQLQLDGYGHVFDMVDKYLGVGNAITDAAGVRLAELADFVCLVWEQPDAGFWELPEPAHHTQSKLGCALALERATDLAGRGAVPDGGVERWRETRAAIAAYVERHCWDERRGAYVATAGGDGLDAAILLAARGGLLGEDRERLSNTIDVLARELRAGPGDGPLLMYRTTGLAGREGAFLACSFWMAEALARVGRLEEAEAILDDLVGLGGERGLLPEELDPETGAFRGNFPQALTHLALINAADVCARVRDGRAIDPHRPRGEATTRA